MNLEKGFNPENLKQVREYLNAKFAEIQKEAGISLSLGTMTYEASEFRATLTAKAGVINKEEEAKKEWDKYCMQFGLRPEWFGKSFRR